VDADSVTVGNFTAAVVRFLWFAYPQVVSEED
jgi:hypothetical protein